MIVEKKTTEIYGKHIAVTGEFLHWDYEVVKALVLASVIKQTDYEPVVEIEFNELVRQINVHMTHSNIDWLDDDPLEVFMGTDEFLFVFTYKEKIVIVLDMEYFMACEHAGFDFDYF